MHVFRWKKVFAPMLIAALPLALGCEAGEQDGPPAGQGQPPAQQQGQPGQQPPGPQPPAQQPQTIDVSEDELETFAEVYLELDQVRTDTETRLEGAEGADEQQQIEQDASAEMQTVLDDHEMTIQEYQQVAQAINTDPELMAEFEQILQEEDGP